MAMIICGRFRSILSNHSIQSILHATGCSATKLNRFISSICLGCNKPTTSRTPVALPTIGKVSIRYNHSFEKTVENFILPDIGEGINEVVIREWKVKLGDIVKEFDGICEVESDKATATISSRFEGTIRRIYYEVGDMAKVGKPLVDIEVTKSSATIPEKDKLPLDVPSSTQQIPAAQPCESSSDPSQIFTTLPSVRRLAKENGVDLSMVRPSGRQGHILKEDVLSFLEQLEANVEPPPEKIEPVEANANVRLETMKPLRGIKKAMFKTMTQSLKIPHFNYSDEIDMDRLVEASRRRNQDSNSSSEKITNLAFIIKMVSLALREYPHLNASVDENGEHLIEKHYHNIGVAVDTPAGLVVPNIKNVQSLSINEINSELKRLRELGYVSKLGPNDLTGGTITLSNIGAIGGVFGVPVLVSPEIVIGALGRTRKLPRFDSSGKIVASQIMQIVWSADHRVVDGASLSRFSNLLKRYLEDPETALLSLI